MSIFVVINFNSLYDVIFSFMIMSGVWWNTSHHDSDRNRHIPHNDDSISISTLSKDICNESSRKYSNSKIHKYKYLYIYIYLYLFRFSYDEQMFQKNCIWGLQNMKESSQGSIQIRSRWSVFSFDEVLDIAYFSQIYVLLLSNSFSNTTR